jgi:YVTN family beta-propeller protein
MKRAALLALLFLTTFAAAQSATPAKSKSGYHLKDTWNVGGEGGWDYLTVDAPSRKLYLSRGTHVMVLDADSGKQIADIADTQGVHGIALDPANHKGYISAGRANQVVVFDTNTYKTETTVKTGENPDAILFDPFSKTVFTFNGRSHDATAINSTKNEVAKTIPLDGKPEFGVSDGKGRVYVNIEDKSEIQVIDTKTLEVVARWSLAPCEEPSGLAIDLKNGRLFSGCDNKLMAISDAAKGKVVTTVPIGAGVDANAFDASANYAFSSNGGDATLTIVKVKSKSDFEVVDNVATKRGARTMALDTKTHNIFLVTADFEPASPQEPGKPRVRPTMKPSSFVVLVVGK